MAAANKQWFWRLVNEAAPWNSAAWRLLNSRFGQLQEVLQRAHSALFDEHEPPADGATTIAVGRSGFVTTQNTAPTAVTTFTGAVKNQRMTVRAGDSETTFVDGPTLRLDQGTDWVALKGEVRDFWTPDGSTWYQVPRSLTVPDA